MQTTSQTSAAFSLHPSRLPPLLFKLISRLAHLMGVCHTERLWMTNSGIIKDFFLFFAIQLLQ